MIHRLTKVITGLIFLVVLSIALMAGYGQLSQTGHLFVIESASMAPNLKTGSLVLVWRFSSYKKGEVITYQSLQNKRTFVTHRIEKEIESENNEYVTKGDSNQSSDVQKVSGDQIQGKVIASVPSIGFLVLWAQQPVGVVILIVIPSSLLIYEEMRKIVLEGQALLKSLYKAK